ncbi:MAG: UDP-N-acetylmuramoyl-tripeptide--D-alanyl-D-alanine ligase [bacterium]|nr:UDP-N-acetylmuramoyl-tripeptide--D-alanyl-D-alanine ligase [bacterium]
MKADFNITAEKIAGICGGTILCGNGAAAIDSISTDSRELGEKSLFIPIIGERFDGHEFIETLCEQGVITAFLTMKQGYKDIAEKHGITVLECGDTLRALGAIAAAHRDSINPEVIGITGTNGKTTTKELVYAILKEQNSVLKNVKNYNNEIGVPFTLLQLEKSHTMAVIEMGMNHSGELDRLSKITRPNLSLITNVGEGHLEFLGSVENVALAKSEIMHGMEQGTTILVNKETVCFDLVQEQAVKRGLRLKTYGVKKDADIFPERYSLTREGVKLSYRGEELFIPLYGIHNVYNIMAAIAVAEEYGVDPAVMGRGLLNFENVDGRSQVIEKGYIIINDTYNSNPLSSKYALESVGAIFPERRKIAVLSDMKELGEFAESFHSATGQEAAELGFDLLVVWGEMAGAYSRGALKGGMKQENIISCDTKEKMSEYLVNKITEQDVVLVKGSRSMKMEEVVNALLA